MSSLYSTSLFFLLTIFFTVFSLAPHFTFSYSFATLIKKNNSGHKQHQQPAQNNNIINKDGRAAILLEMERFPE
jgi:hypothetical protein